MGRRRIRRRNGIGFGMVDTRILWRAGIVGTSLQVTMVLLGHFIPWVVQNAFAFGGMFISGVAGLLYARDLDRGYRAGALGGLILGPSCAAIGVVLSVLLGDTPPQVIAFAVLVSALTGAVGGLFGQMGANMRSALDARR
jgi:hypothetical protein